MSLPMLTILITGFNKGIGFEIALHLSKLEHIHLFVSGRNPALVQQSASSLKAEEGCQAIIDNVVLDISDDLSIQAAVREVEAKLGGAALDVLVVRMFLQRMQFNR